MKNWCPLTLLLLIVIAPLQLLPADNYYIVPISSLEFEDNAAPELDQMITHSFWDKEFVTRYPQLQLADTSDQAYVGFPEPEENARNRRNRASQGQMQIAFRLKGDMPLSGKASLVKSGLPARESYAFTFDPQAFEAVGAEAFETIQKAHYARLASANIVGGDWFRYKAGDAYTTDDQRFRGQTLGEFDSSFDLFTGHRAVSENLALDRAIILATSVEGEPVAIDTLTGVTVAPINWTERLVDAPTAIDPLANAIPEDQHVAFFDSIKELNQTLRVVEDEGLSFLKTFSNRAPYAGLAARYQRQMGIFIPDILAEQLPVKSVAITGGDPFLPSGSDVCVLFETDSPAVLKGALEALITIQAQQNGATQSTELDTELDTETSTYLSYENADRSFSSIVFAGANYVAVTNSPVQFKHLHRVAAGETPALGETDEFKFFRQRYPLAEKQTAFIFLSDATIRRWASPAFRIGASRRVRAAAALGQASALSIDDQPLSDTYAELVGTVDMHNGIPRSKHFNTLAFLTPISELDIDYVTPAEKQGYERWRTGYESGWVRFDPIALGIQLDESSMKFDLSVIPLRIGSEYNTFIATAGQASLDKTAITPHAESILMLSYAIDSSSETFQMANRQGSSMLPGLGANPLAWVGESLSVYLDADPFWQEMQTAENSERFIENNLPRLPVGLRVSSKSSIKLAVFLTTLRSFSEQAAPGLLAWATNQHEETAYVSIRATDQAGLPENMDLQIHYAALPGAFLLSLNEGVLKRAISRHLTTPKATDDETIGNYQSYAKADFESLESYQQIMDGDPLTKQQFISWEALPILNEWHQRFPDRDPLEVHATYFQERITCPGGMGYQWNEVLGSMESVAFGSPETPRGTAQPISLLKNWAEGETKIHFQDNELRVNAQVQR
jgi:hypothetical protein